MFASDDVWSCIPVGVKPNLGEFISTLLKSKADSTSRRYKKEISLLNFVIPPTFSQCLLFLLRLKSFIYLRFIRVLTLMLL